MKRHLMLLSLLAAGFANTALANAELAEAKQCNVCHTLAKETIGPSYFCCSTHFTSVAAS